MLRLSTLAVVALTLGVGMTGCSRDTGWQSVSDDHPEMIAAREKVLETYPDFVALLKNRRPQTIYGADVLYEEDGKSEILMIDVISADENEITGVINNFPMEVDLLNGTEITVPVDALQDWVVDFPDGEREGGHVSAVRARLQRPAEQQSGG